MYKSFKQHERKIFVIVWSFDAIFAPNLSSPDRTIMPPGKDGLCYSVTKMKRRIG